MTQRAKGKRTVLKEVTEARRHSAPEVKTVAPIAVYPANEELRKRISDAARDQNNSMSGFLIYLFRQWEKSRAEVKPV